MKLYDKILFTFDVGHYKHIEHIDGILREKFQAICKALYIYSALSANENLLAFLNTHTLVCHGTLRGQWLCNFDILGCRMLAANKTGSEIVSPWRPER